MSKRVGLSVEVEEKLQKKQKKTLNPKEGKKSGRKLLTMGQMESHNK